MDNQKNENANESGDRGHRDHTEGGDHKSGRQGGGPSERQSMAGEQGAKAEKEDKYTNSHTEAGDVHGRGTLKDNSGDDQRDEDRGTGLHLGDDYRIDPVTGEQNKDVRREGGAANHKGGGHEGTGGGKSSGGAGHGPQDKSNSGNSGKNSGNGGNHQNKQTNGGPSGNDKEEGGNSNKNPESGKTGGGHQHGGEFPPRTRQDPNAEGSSAGSH